jgi:Domain of unknown function (DUF4349)
MKRLPLKPLLVSALVAVAAFGGLVLTRSSRSGGMAMAVRAPMPPVPVSPGLAGGVVEAEAVPERKTDVMASMESGRMLVRTGSVSLEVERYRPAAARAEAIAMAEGGYLADAQVSRESGDRDRGTLTFRVPADRFDAVLRSLESLGRLDGASFSTQDIGREYMDLETRLGAKRDTEARLRELLRARTARLSDVLAAEKELSRVIEEREAMQGERRYYDRQRTLSTITVDLHEPPALLRENALAPLREALGRALPLLSASLAALVYAASAALPWALLAFGLWRLYRRHAVRRLVRVTMER